jgi:hypothetical protein
MVAEVCVNVDVGVECWWACLLNTTQLGANADKTSPTLI